MERCLTHSRYLKYLLSISWQTIYQSCFNLCIGKSGLIVKRVNAEIYNSSARTEESYPPEPPAIHEKLSVCAVRSDSQLSPPHSDYEERISRALYYLFLSYQPQPSNIRVRDKLIDHFIQLSIRCPGSSF